MKRAGFRLQPVLELRRSEERAAEASVAAVRSRVMAVRTSPEVSDRGRTAAASVVS